MSLHFISLLVGQKITKRYSHSHLLSVKKTLYKQLKTSVPSRVPWALRITEQTFRYLRKSVADSTHLAKVGWTSSNCFLFLFLPDAFISRFLDLRGGVILGMRKDSYSERKELNLKKKKKTPFLHYVLP